MYTVKDVARIMDISEHTIRFYANKGLFPKMKRNINDVRQFDEDDLRWIQLVICMKSIGTPLKEIKHYIELCLEGDGTIKERYEIILKQKRSALLRMKELKKQMALLDYKENYYRDLIENHSKDKYNPIYGEDIESCSKVKDKI